MVTWISAGPGKHGLRYREHPTRTLGVAKSKRAVRYYTSQYYWHGKGGTDTFGWEDEFPGGIHGIESMAAQLRLNRTSQTPPFTYKEILTARADDLAAIEQAELDKQLGQEQQNRLVLNNMFQEYCTVHSTKVSLNTEQSYFKTWIKPALGKKCLDEIKLLDLERIRLKMHKAGRAPQTIAHVKNIVRQVFHYAIDHDLYYGPVPTLKFLKKQRYNNKRERFLSYREADELLAEIRLHSRQCYEMAKVSLYTGMRFGEVAGIRWQHINLSQRTIFIAEPKNDTSRTSLIDPDIIELFNSMTQGAPDELVFPSTNGKVMIQVSDTFNRSVVKLGLNTGISDRRLKVVFHTLRHTYASWMANLGVPTQVISRVLGHASATMTDRYTHINDNSVQEAVMAVYAKRKSQRKIIPLAQEKST